MRTTAASSTPSTCSKGGSGRGVGRLLVSAVARRLLVDGFRSMLLWVLEDNHPARRFYESLGGGLVGRETITIGGTDLVEVSYGWTDIAGLLRDLEDSRLC